jgi:Zn-dependent protease
MFESFSIGRYFGINLRIQWCLIFFMGIICCLNPEHGFMFTLAILSVIPHEFSHSLTARFLGHKVGDILLTPFGGIAQIEFKKKYSPKNEFLITLAGPLVNVAIAIFSFGLLLYLNTISYEETFLHKFVSMLLRINVVLVVFNCLPIFPLDGGRLFRSSLGFFTNELLATKIACTIAKVLCLFLAAFAIWIGNPMLVLITVFLFVAAIQEYKIVYNKFNSHEDTTLA